MIAQKNKLILQYVHVLDKQVLFLQMPTVLPLKYELALKEVKRR
jgi:hypothetical protein